jgi:hypothetical protein
MRWLVCRRPVPRAEARSDVSVLGFLDGNDKWNSSSFTGININNYHGALLPGIVNLDAAAPKVALWTAVIPFLPRELRAVPDKETRARRKRVVRIHREAGGGLTRERKS